MVTKAAKARILTYHYIPNNGAFLFAYSLLELLQKEFQAFEVKVLDYKSKQLVTFEFLKRFKIFREVPLFYSKRAMMWNRQIEKYLELDKEFPKFANNEKLQKYLANHYGFLVVGMDVWCITNSVYRPKFPNIYWLPKSTQIPKIAYSVSAYNSNSYLIQQSIDQISKYLDSFDVIGARDGFTFDLVRKLRKRAGGVIDLIPDPTFMYKITETGVYKKLELLGVDFSKPILGLLLYGDDKLSCEIRSHYKSKGYQILALGMYNPFADLNLGHILTPFEWAETFRYLTFCISDRFHGTIFCLKNKIPFMCLEKDRILPRKQSKIHDLLAGFGLETCYQNPADDHFTSFQFFAHASQIEAAWAHDFKPALQPQIDVRKQQHVEFIHKLKKVLNTQHVKC